MSEFNMDRVHAIWRRFSEFMAQDSAAANNKGNSVRFMCDPNDETGLSGWVTRTRDGKEVHRATIAAGHGVGPGGEPVLVIRRIEVKPGIVHTSSDVREFTTYLDTAWWQAVDAVAAKAKSTTPGLDTDEEDFTADELAELEEPHPRKGHGMLSDHMREIEAHRRAFPFQGHDLVLRISAVDFKTLDFVASLALADLMDFSNGNPRTRSGCGTQARWYFSYEPKPWGGDYPTPEDYHGP